MARSTRQDCAPRVASLLSTNRASYRVYCIERDTCALMSLPGTDLQKYSLVSLYMNFSRALTFVNFSAVPSIPPTPAARHRALKVWGSKVPPPPSAPGAVVPAGSLLSHEGSPASPPDPPRSATRRSPRGRRWRWAPHAGDRVGRPGVTSAPEHGAPGGWTPIRARDVWNTARSSTQATPAWRTSVHIDHTRRCRNRCSNRRST